eukprot:m.5586 g.5586  ORF g.5586 m.5586 type:complete len:135 (-) comp2432_c0_seq1:208-612(-)
MTILGVAVVGRKNQPLLIRVNEECPPSEPIEHIVYSALDIVEEQTALNGKKYQQLFLGSLYPLEDGRCFGYITNTKIKFFIITDASTSKESEVKQYFERMHNTYIQVASSPFFKHEAPLTSTKLISFIDTMFGK